MRLFGAPVNGAASRLDYRCHPVSSLQDGGSPTILQIDYLRAPVPLAGSARLVDDRRGAWHGDNIVAPAFDGINLDDFVSLRGNKSNSCDN